MQTYLSESPDATQEIARSLAATLQGGETLLLYGDLGSGKTTFTQGLAGALGITRRVNSPTFVIMRTYRIKNQESRIKNLYHIDLYRIESEKDLEGLGLEEVIGREDAVVVIEWPEKVRTLLPERHTDVRFEYVNDNKRKILISS